MKPSLWSGIETKKTLTEAQEEFLNSFYAIEAWNYPVWYVGYSGGKDSTALVTYLAHAMETGRLPRPEKVVVQYADTGMEVPPLQWSALSIMQTLRERYGFETRILRPELAERWFVYMLGRGVALPSNGMRWCTRQLKADPMKQNVLAIKQEAGKPLLITGVREGESAVRDGVITATCSKDGGECGQGYMHVKTSKDTGTDSHAPILGWRVCHVWDWLMWDAPSYGFDTADIAAIYGQDVSDGEEPLSSRTGCINCPLVTDPKGEHPRPDKMLERVIAIPKYSYLAPLTRLLDVYVELNQDSNRLRRVVLRKKTGEAHYPKGPFSLEARRWGLIQVKAIQDEVNVNARRVDMPEVSLINAEEEQRILELIEANTWPNGWKGTELLASNFSVPEETPKFSQLPLMEEAS
jgi:DNA sulfur modification protein DndC